VLDQAGVTRAILLGHSDGASIATIYAGSVSDMRVRGLILMAPHFFTEVVGLDAIRASWDAYTNGGLRDRLAPYHSDVDAAFYGWHDAWTDPGFHAWNIADAIDHLRVPVLAIQGRQDVYGTLAQITELAERMYAPIETCILDGCGHAPHREKPDQTLAAISEFCARLLRLEQEDVRLG
jgi:pimeloyl-ACP methyl ester carboxylesterase